MLQFYDNALQALQFHVFLTGPNEIVIGVVVGLVEILGNNGLIFHLEIILARVQGTVTIVGRLHILIVASSVVPSDMGTFDLVPSLFTVPGATAQL